MSNSTDKHDLKHTPGPWGIGYYQTRYGHTQAIISSPGIANVCKTEVAGRPLGPVEADARLIVAAPDMKDALMYAPSPLAADQLQEPNPHLREQYIKGFLAEYQRWFIGQRWEAVAKALMPEGLVEELRQAGQKGRA